MTREDDEIALAMEIRDRFARRLLAGETPQQRLARFSQLQRQMFDLLRASPDGYRHFFRRNLQSRRVEVIDGEWRPVSPDRRASQA